jgi:Flp pilus assembly protein TadG
MKYIPSNAERPMDRRRRAVRPGAPRRGGAVIEFAAVLPLLAALFVITVDFGRMFYYQITIENCARNGAHFGSGLKSYQETGCVKPYDSITNAILADGGTLNPPLAASNVAVTYGTGSDGNSNVVVTITYPFQSITNFPGLGPFNLQATTKMRVAPP